MAKTRTEITFEQHQRTVVRTRRHGQRTAWCEECASLVIALTPDEAARLLATTTRVIFRRVEAGTLHFSETEGGALLICAASLGLNLTD
jgi:hypothetical protein